MTPNMKIFIVEDEALVVMELKDRLSRLGYAVTGTAARGEKALELIAANPPDLVLMDICLAGQIDGIETAARLRAQHPVPVVFLTAYSDDELLRQAGDVEPFGYLVKPFEERELHATIQMALCRHRLERRLSEANAQLEDKVRERTAMLARSEALNLAILNSVDVEIVVLDRNGMIISVNEAWRRFARENGPDPGAPVPNTEIGDNYLDACLSAEAGAAAHDDCVGCDGIRAVLDGRLANCTMEYPCHSPGQQRWFKMVVSPLNSEEGGVVIAHTDISESKAAARALHERERLLTSINQNLVGAFVYRLEVTSARRIRYNYVSPNVEEVTGLSPAALLEDGDQVFALLIADELPRYRDKITESARTGERLDFELRFRHAVDGSVRWLRVRGRNVERRSNGTIVHEGISMDITAAKEAEAENRKLALVAARTINGVVLTDSQTRIEWVNEGFTRISGYTLDEVRGRVPGRFLQGPATDSDVRAQIGAALRAGRGCGAELINYAKDGRQYWVDIEIQPLHDSAGRVTHFMAIEKDITQRKAADDVLHLTTANLAARTAALEAAREVAERAQLSKTRFFAAASHDLLQPLNAARIFASSLGERLDLSPATVRIVERIDAALRNAEEVVDVLVNVAKLDTGAVRPMVEDVNLGEMLRGLMGQFSSIAEQRHLKLRLGPCKVTVRSDRLLLRRVFQNLVSNALRYTARGGVLVGVRRLSGARIRVDIVDTGPGIPRESLSSVFEEFRRLGRASPWGEKGLGLGLSICKRICDLLDHELTVSSVVGRGSNFSVNLGKGRSWHAARVVKSPRVREVRVQPGLSLRVLCIDDDVDVLDAMTTLLIGWGVSCERAPSRDLAIEMARSCRPDVVLVDFQFDGDESFTGLDIIKSIRALYPERPPVAMLITANHSDDLKATTREQGIPVLYKPLRVSRLRSLLEAVSL